MSVKVSRSEFFSAMREKFGRLRQEQVDGITRLLDLFEKSSPLLVNQAAYVLATPWHETGKTMQPVREANGTSDEQVIKRLDAAWKRGKLPQVKTPYWRRDAAGKAWYGRGLVQLTHRYNYEKAEELTGHPLTEDPDLALDPEISSEILLVGMQVGMFTGRDLDDYLTATKTQYRPARAIINGSDRAREIAQIAEKFELCLRAAG